MNPQAVTTLIDAVSRLPKAKHYADGDPNLGLVTCLCGKRTPIAQARAFHTGHITAIDPRCPSCLRDSIALASVVCVGRTCRRVVAHLKPGKDKTGFIIQRGACYHIEACPSCAPGTKTSTILEKQIFMQKMGIPLPNPNPSST